LLDLFPIAGGRHAPLRRFVVDDLDRPEFMTERLAVLRFAASGIDVDSSVLPIDHAGVVPLGPPVIDRPGPVVHREASLLLERLACPQGEARPLLRISAAMRSG